MLLFAARIIGVSFLKVASTKLFRKTKLGSSFYNLYIKISFWVQKKYGIDILHAEDVSFGNKFPALLKRIERLERKIKELEKG